MNLALIAITILLNGYCIYKKLNNRLTAILLGAYNGAVLACLLSQ